MDTDEQNFPIDKHICQLRCPHFTIDYNMGVDKEAGKGRRQRTFNEGVKVASTFDRCGLVGKSICGMSAFVSCPFYLEQVLVGGQNALEGIEIRSFPLSQLIGCTLVFRKQEDRRGLVEWEGIVLERQVHGFVMRRPDVGRPTLLTTDVLLRLWQLFRLKRTPDAKEELVKFVDG
jgi:hypothetical protein